MNGEKIFELNFDVTGVTDCGITLDAVLSGQTAVPPQGIRLDVAFEGRASGRLSGQVRGVDYIRMRADGRIDLDIRSTIETDDGHRIALSASGAGTPRTTSPMADIFENITLLTAAAPYDWVNTRQIWAIGTVDFAAGKIVLTGYMQ